MLVACSRAPVSFANVNLTGTALYNSVEIGFRGAPRAVQNSNYSLVAADRGTSLAKTNTSGIIYTVPSGTFSAGDIVLIRNNGSAGNITVAGSGVTLQLGGSTTTGDRIVAPGGIASLYFDSATTAVVSGAGVS